MGNQRTNGTCGVCGAGIEAHQEAVRCGGCGQLVHAFGCATSVRDARGRVLCADCAEKAINEEAARRAA